MLGVIAVVVVAAVSAVRGGSQVPAGTATTAGARPPRPATVASRWRTRGSARSRRPVRFPAVSWCSTPSTCRPRVLDLATLELGPPGPPTACRAWFDPGGRYGAAALPEREGIWLLDIAAGTVGRQLSRSAESVVFADDGTVLAQCGDDGRTIVVELAGGPDRPLTGCRPAFAPDGSVLTRPDARLPTSLLRDGREILGFSQLEGGLPPSPDGAVSVIGYDEGEDGLLAVLVARFPGRSQGSGLRPERPAAADARALAPRDARAGAPDRRRHVGIRIARRAGPVGEVCPRDVQRSRPPRRGGPAPARRAQSSGSGSSASRGRPTERGSRSPRPTGSRSGPGRRSSSRTSSR